MNPFLGHEQCRAMIAELAELLPRLLGARNTDFQLEAAEPVGLRRSRRDPVFTGGSVVGLLITDPAAPPPSRTKDIDVVLEIIGYGEFAAMENLLRQAGFTQNWHEDVPLVAWHWHGTRVDFLPHRPMEMMKTNRWFPRLVDAAERVEVLPGRFAWCASAPCFLATKMEAFFSRGKGDYLMSKDIEDILAVVDGRLEIIDEMALASPEVADFIKHTLAGLLGEYHFRECIPRIVPEPEREGLLVSRLRKIAGV